MKLRSVKGTNDILPEQQGAWSAIVNAAERVLGNAGAGHITVPIFEYAEVFERSVGESSDIVVQKEMYAFEDRGGRTLALRPELTAGIMRAFSEHGMHTRPAPVKLWSYGPAFRAENVQRGRYRQFHQIDYEIVGTDSPLADAETVQLMYDVLAECGLTRHVMMLGSVGDPEDAAAYNAYLREQLGPRSADLSEVSRERLRLNPMRVLDSKEKQDQELIAGLDRPLDRLAEPARMHFEQVRRYLDDWGVPYEVDTSIVRGLDYYRRTAFEAHHQGIGAQSALGGGGRYDGLLKLLGGPDLPAIGWAFGLERIADAMSEEAASSSAEDGDVRLFLVPLDEEAVSEAAGLAVKLRPTGRVEYPYHRRAPGKGLGEADKRGATHAALRGQSEREAGVWQLKDLRTGEQRAVSQEDLKALLESAA
ncbi:MAG TPA: histidine--tRNA ligase [Trueperaceae bacterium]|nr:histidine--tRNA ligase [Trueperaceae bacterium]